MENSDGWDQHTHTVSVAHDPMHSDKVGWLDSPLNQFEWGKDFRFPNWCEKVGCPAETSNEETRR